MTSPPGFVVLRFHWVCVGVILPACDMFRDWTFDSPVCTNEWRWWSTLGSSAVLRICVSSVCRRPVCHDHGGLISSTSILTASGLGSKVQVEPLLFRLILWCTQELTSGCPLPLAPLAWAMFLIQPRGIHAAPSHLRANQLHNFWCHCTWDVVPVLGVLKDLILAVANTSTSLCAQDIIIAPAVCHCAERWCCCSVRERLFFASCVDVRFCPSFRLGRIWSSSCGTPRLCRRSRPSVRLLCGLLSQMPVQSSCNPLNCLPHLVQVFLWSTSILQRIKCAASVEKGKFLCASQAARRASFFSSCGLDLHTLGVGLVFDGQ